MFSSTVSFCSWQERSRGGGRALDQLVGEPLGDSGLWETGSTLLNGVHGALSPRSPHRKEPHRQHCELPAETMPSCCLPCACFQRMRTSFLDPVWAVGGAGGYCRGGSGHLLGNCRGRAGRHLKLSFPEGAGSPQVTGPVSSRGETARPQDSQQGALPLLLSGPCKC